MSNERKTEAGSAETPGSASDVAAVPVRCDCGWKLGIMPHNLEEVANGVWGTIPCQNCGTRLNDKIKAVTDAPTPT